MPLICIGPICIPVSAVLPLLLWAVKPLWESLSEETRDRITRTVRPIYEWLQTHMLCYLPFGTKTGSSAGAAKAPSSTSGDIDESFANKLIKDCTEGNGRMHSISTIGELMAAQKVSHDRGCALVLDFTATWCGPCTKIKPQFEALAQAQPHDLFALVDVDEAQDVQAACKVIALPTFQVYRGHRRVSEERGGTEGVIERVRKVVQEGTKKDS